MEEKDYIKNFSEEMIKKLELRKDRYVPMSWKKLDFKRLSFLLYEEIAELHDSYNKGNLELAKSDAVDVANYGMFIYELILEEIKNASKPNN